MRGQQSTRYWALAVVVTIAVGAAAGVAGGLLLALLRGVQHLAYGYRETSFFVGVERTPPWRRVVAMAAGGVVVATGWWALRTRAHGLRTVPAALRGGQSRLPFVGTAADAVLQILAVGCGASLGREGAPRQVGAAVAGWLAGRAGLVDRHRRTLFACGAGAGLAAVYDVPLAGALFTLEALLLPLAAEGHLQRLRTAWSAVVPALVTAGIATLVARPVVGGQPLYEVGRYRLTASLLVWAVLVGPLMGAVGVGFDRLTTAAGQRAPEGRRLLLVLPAVFTALGALAMAYPQLLGNGRGPAQLAFAGAMTLPALAVLALLKPLATAACLGAGANGGRLTPALATGALAGATTARLWSLVWSGSPAGPCAVVAAAAVLAVTLRAPLTSLALVLELTANGWTLGLPLVMATSGAVLVGGLARRHRRSPSTAPGPHPAEKK